MYVYWRHKQWDWQSVPANAGEQDFELCCITQRFTGCLVQFVTTAITTGCLPSWTLKGYNDLMSTLLGLDRLPVSILMPQAQERRIDHYSPINCSQEMIWSFLLFDDWRISIWWRIKIWSNKDNGNEYYLSILDANNTREEYFTRWQEMKGVVLAVEKCMEWAIVYTR